MRESDHRSGYRTAGALLTRWDRKFIDEQYRYAAEVIKVFSEAEEFPKQIPDGTLDMSYALDSVLFGLPKYFVGG